MLLHPFESRHMTHSRRGGHILTRQDIAENARHDARESSMYRVKDLTCQGKLGETWAKLGLGPPAITTRANPGWKTFRLLSLGK